jgi:hypothetical protein
MTHATLMNWEICLDAAGFCCCILSILYLFKLKRKTVFKDRLTDPAKREDDGPFKATPIELPAETTFEGILTSVRNETKMTVVAGGRAGAAADPYDEVRRLLDLGMEPQLIADRMKIPTCEIDLIVSLQQMQPEPVADKTSENAYGETLA